MIYNINETTLPHNFSKGLYEEKLYDLADSHTDKIFDVLFTGTSELLNANRSICIEQDRPVAVTFEKLDGSIIAAAILRFMKNEDESKPGNWNLVWTFNESDIPENTLRISIKDEQAHTFYKAIGGERYGIAFRSGSVVTLMTYPLEQLHKWLDENASETEEVGIEQPAVFQARVAVENGEKVFAIEPMGEIKQLIKDDTSIEK